ncbi:hypothetical protein BJ166DRAFT_356120 [Pestalotiopsis sp. NC0098]|nr:hypothetical protein BJ166DRAFT_356120 [Pestalotiopsis sp. NC0098]
MASIGDVASLIQKIPDVIDWCQGVHFAPKERRALTEQINILRLTFNGLRDNQLLLLVSVLEHEQLKDTIALLDPRLESLQKELSKSSKRWKGYLKRLQWPTKKADVQARITDLRQTVHDIKAFQEIAQTGQEERERIRSWLEPSIAKKLHDTNYVRHVANGTGEGLLHSKEFKDWLSTRNGVLWCNGNQGSGKTGQIKVIESHFRDSKLSSYYELAVVYCADGDLRNLQDPMDVIMSMWAQLVPEKSLSHLRFPEESLRDLIMTHRSGGYMMLSKESATRLKLDILCYQIANSRPTILILDGLDEVPSTSPLQQEIVRLLIEVQQRTNNCHLLFTSRPYISIHTIFNHHSQHCSLINYKLKVSELDLKQYVEEQARINYWRIGDQQDSIQRVVDILVPKCIGEESFLLASFYMNEILKTRDLLQLDRTLKSLPKTLGGTYATGLRRLSKECPEPQDGLPCKAIQALYWVTFAKRPLKAEELENVLAVYEDESDTDFNRDGLMSLKAIESLCAELLVVDSATAQVSVGHKTLADHLKHPGTIKEWWPNRSPNEYMASVLMKYLSFECMKRSSGTGMRMDRLDRQLPLLQYALQYWGDYMADVRDTAAIWDQVYDFLTGPSQDWSRHVKTKAADVVAQRGETWVLRRTAAVSSGNVGPLHWAVNFNFLALVNRLSEHERVHPTETPVSISPLGLAVSQRRLEMTRCLIENGADVNDEGRAGRPRRPPLYDATFCGSIACARALLDAGASCSTRKEDNEESVLWGLYWVDRLEISNMVADYISCEDQSTAEGLQFLVRGGYTKQLERAIRQGQNINIPCHNGKRALDYAYELDNRELIDILKSHGATTRLCWPPFKLGSSSIPQNLPEPQPAGPAIIKQTSFEEKGRIYQSWGQVVLDVPIDQTFSLPVRSLVFETISSDQGWSSHTGKGTYLSSAHGSSFTVRIRNQQKDYEFALQHNVHASRKLRMHTNVWNLSELEESFPMRAQCIKAMKHGSSLQVVANAKGQGWINKVQFARVRVYGEEVNL